MRLNLGAFFRWTGLFILVVAAGILANSVQALHEAGVWNHLQTVLFDFSATLPMDGPLGSVLAGMFGYQDAPTVSTLGAYLIYLVVALVMFFPAPAPASSASQPVVFRFQPIRAPMSKPVSSGLASPRLALGGGRLGGRDDRRRRPVLLRLENGRGQAPGNHDEVLVTIHPHSCEPNALTVPAGRASFRIVNRSDRAVEWEILDGVLVIEERENIAPGLSQVINANLLPGDYAITCGLLSNPRGTLHVTPTAASDAAAKARPSMVAFVGPLSEFRVYLSSQGTR
jgi:hypothetical protein